MSSTASGDGTKLKLPEVTLVMIETREHVLARMAIADCLRVAEFGDVLILTDKHEKFDGLDCAARFSYVPDWPNKLGWSRSWWYDVPPLLQTEMTLNVQWDSWIIDPEMWRDEFLEYSYCGSPWWYVDGKNVGNGGFSLISSRLKRYVADRRDKYPCDTAVDDDLLCRKYRPQLEEAGFVWAPEAVAHDFAFECCRPSPTSKHFGFHGIFNWGEVLPRDRLLERMKIAMQSPYIANPNNHFMKAFAQRNPDVLSEIAATAGA